MIEPILLTMTQVSTYAQHALLTRASGFFFLRDGRLFLVSSRHVMIDEASGHRPDRIEIDLHVDPDNFAESVLVSLPLYRGGQALWRQGIDTAGAIDVAVLEVPPGTLPAGVVHRAFEPVHLPSPDDRIEVGMPVLMFGFPLGFHDRLHHMPVARAAVIASSWGLRFQGEGYFLTDARTHRGSSGAPVIMALAAPSRARAGLPWLLLGVHSARLDVGSRDRGLDESLGLNCAWYADNLMTLTAG